MGKKDVKLYEYLSDTRRFADLFNAACFDGKQVLDGKLLESYAERCRDGEKSYYRDIVKRAKQGNKYLIAAIENQNQIDYEMPYRIMNYDYMEYRKQLEEIHSRKRHERKNRGMRRNKFAEKLNAMERLCPVYTLCFYHGKEPWEQPKALRDMMEFGGENTQEWQKLFCDYRMNFVNAADETLADKCGTELKYLLKVICYQNDKEKLRELLQEDTYKNLDRETAEVIAVFADMKYAAENMDEYKNENGGYDMCEAMREIKKDCREAGRREGRREGRRSGLREGHEEGVSAMIRNLMQTMKLSAEDAMDILLIPKEERARYVKILQR